MNEKNSWIHSALLRGTILIFAACVAGCGGDVKQGLAAGERQRIVEEITETLNKYREAALRKDLTAVKNFWSNADEFLIAGDGAILGGSKWWYDKLDWYDKDTVKWNSWEWRRGEKFC